MRTLLDRLPDVRSFLASPAEAADDRSFGRFDRVFVPAIVTVYAVCMPLWSLGHLLITPHRPSAAVAATLATACSLPLQLWLLAPAAVARRPRHPGWLIAAFMAVNLAAFPFIGVLWFAAGQQLAVLAIVYLPLRWSVAAVALLTSIPAAVALAGHDQNTAGYFAQNTPFYPLTIGLLIFLVRAIGELRARRRDLTDTAVIRERVRIDDELSAALGATLEQLIADAERAAQVAMADPEAAERELPALTGASRRALALTRRMVSRYQRITVGSELRTAVALLTAAGIVSEVEVPSDVQRMILDSQQLAGFRSGLTVLLRDEAADSCVITAVGGDGDLRLEIRGQLQAPR